MKKFMLICAPVTSRSGYGDHARDVVRSFLKLNKFDIKIWDVNWGETPRDALDKKTDEQIIKRILKTPNVDKQPDVYVDIRIPNEFQQFGKVNIGVTAGIETNAVSNNWIENCNKMDLIIVPSEHSKDGFVKALYEKIQQLPNFSIIILSLCLPFNSEIKHFIRLLCVNIIDILSIIILYIILKY